MQRCLDRQESQSPTGFSTERNVSMDAATKRIGADTAYAYLSRMWKNWRLSRAYPKRGATESVGAYGERVAAFFLERKGYIILERSYRQKSGEIDVIAVWERKVVVFVEVKTWAVCKENTGGPSDAVDSAKQEKISKTAMRYMKRHRLLESAGRADVIEIVLGSCPERPSIRHFENAFEAVGSFQMFS
ncbi:MAG: YraN family protein [Planctomycetota bacterium]|nr:YraN family protein [Planctomycetota bacterium]